MELINYGALSFRKDSPLGEIDNLICSIGCDKELLADTQQQYDKESYVKQLREEYAATGISDQEIQERYEEHCASLDDDCSFYADKINENKKALVEKMREFPQKDTLKAFLSERQSYFRDKANKETEPLYRKDANYQEAATVEAKIGFNKYVEKSRQA